MHDHDNTSLKQSKCDKPSLTVVKAVVLDGYYIALKDSSYVFKIDAVLVDIGESFVFVPLELHNAIVTTICRCIKNISALGSRTA